MSLEHFNSVFSGQVYCGLPSTWQEMGPGLFQRHYALCDGVLVSIQFLWSLVLLIFNFFSPLSFKLVCKEFFNYYFITCIWNPTRLLRRSFLQKQLTSECSLLFLQKSPS